MIKKFDIGKVMVTPCGEWSPQRSYELLSIVRYKGEGYISLQDCTGIEPSTEGERVWMKFADKGAEPVISIDDTGKVYVDGVLLTDIFCDIKNATERIVANENERRANEGYRVANENARVNAEKATAVLEAERIKAEQNRNLAERERVNSENERRAREVERQNKSEEYSRNEAERKSEEVGRRYAEHNRVKVEGERVLAEQNRSTNEDNRRLAEVDRTQAERERLEVFKSLSEDLNNAIKQALNLSNSNVSIPEWESTKRYKKGVLCCNDTFIFKSIECGNEGHEPPYKGLYKDLENLNKIGEYVGDEYWEVVGLNPHGVLLQTANFINKTDKALEDVDIEITNIKASALNQEESLNEIKGKVSTLEQTATKLEGKDTEQEGKLTSLETLTTQHAEQLTTLNSKIENNKGVVVDLGAKVEELEPIIRANTTKNSEQDQRLTYLEGKEQVDLTPLNNRVSTLETKNEEQDSEIASLKEKEQSTTSKVDALRDIIDERLHDIDRLKGLNSTVEEHISKITAIEAKDTEQDERLTALESRPSTGGEGTPLDTPTAEDVVAMRAQIANLTRLYEALNLDPEKKKN